MIKIKETGVIFQNPIPAVRPLQAQCPGFCDLGSGEIICVQKRAAATAAVIADFALSRSVDYGLTWRDEGTIWDRSKDDRAFSYGYSYPTLLENGDVVLAGYRWDRSRSDPDFNFYNPDTLGSVGCDTVLMRSRDRGKTWSAPQVVPPPTEVPVCNATSRVMRLRDGRLMLPLESWKTWDDAGLVKQRSFVMFSGDNGTTWGQHRVAAMDPDFRILYWNGMFSRLQDGRIFVMYWCKDSKTEEDLPIAATYSSDEGNTWAPIYSTKLRGQMGVSCDISSGRVLAMFNRRDNESPGVWAAVSADGGRNWPEDGHTCLWDARGRSQFGNKDADNRSRSIYDEGTMSFGKPDVIPLGDNHYLAGFWATSNFVMHLRYAHLTIE